MVMAHFPEFMLPLEPGLRPLLYKEQKNKKKAEAQNFINKRFSGQHLQ